MVSINRMRDERIGQSEITAYRNGRRDGYSEGHAEGDYGKFRTACLVGLVMFVIGLMLGGMLP